MQKKKWLAMILAGGQGSRLYSLTRKLAKPAVAFGGKYRIIDFTLSNCVNSGIDTVGVLTQYQPLVLNEYIAHGQTWGLDRMYGGVFVLPPYQKQSGSDWYVGTADAIYQNMDFIQRYDPEYVVILSGDHIYKMDYSKMLDFHVEQGAECTISVLEVSPEEAHRFGILDCDDTGRVREFQEKPENPKSNLASMGVYIFSMSALRKYLSADADNIASQKDFGKNIIPTMLEDGAPLYAYNFSGYWKDVGTLDSLWEANMDLNAPELPMNLSDNQWPIYTRDTGLPPQYIGPDAVVQHSIVSNGSEVYGTVCSSVIFPGVIVEKGAEVIGSILMPGSVVKANASVHYVIAADNSVIGENAIVGADPAPPYTGEYWGITIVGNEVTIGESAVIGPRQMVNQDVVAHQEIGTEVPILA